jgi:hypothetical protein
MSKRYFYYNRDENRHPDVTFCIIVDDEGNYARGIAVCSDMDMPRKAVGRAIAEGRATAALKRRTNLFPIRETGTYKGEFNPELTEYEQKILGVWVKHITYKGGTK